VKNARAVAKRIARDLFVKGSGDRAERLVLTIDGPPKQDLGGWSERAMADRIETLLRRLTTGPETP